MRFNAFDFQLKFSFKHTNFVLKENYFFTNDLHSLSTQDKKKFFLASNFLIIVSNRFAMLHIIFYE